MRERERDSISDICQGVEYKKMFQIILRSTVIATAIIDGQKKKKQ